MNRTQIGRMIRLVIDANAELERNDYADVRGPYYRLSNLTGDTTTAGRIEIAAAIYRYARARLRGSRALDNCFEMGDGAIVGAELARRADGDPELHAAIAADFGGAFPEAWRTRDLFTAA